MAFRRSSLLIWMQLLFFRILTLSIQSSCAPDSSHEVFIVYMGAAPQRHVSEVASEHHDLLASVVGSIQTAQDAILYHYHRSFRGFAAKLSSHHAQALRELDGVHSVFKSQQHRAHTTHSWDFLGVGGLNETGNLTSPTAWIFSLRNQSNVIIGFVDSGYWPESLSFQDLGMDPVPLRWRGACVAGESFAPELCNNKVIGARYYYKGAQDAFATNGTVLTGIFSARDTSGHGTHVASTAAGRLVENVGYGSNNIAIGTIQGGAFGARIAIYKACWGESTVCVDADILSAFDDAIADGVDILSVSLGGLIEGEVFTEAISIGSFHASRQGILVAAAAGNEGPDYGTVGNTAPWILTVAASTTDRLLACNVQLGDGSIIPGTYVLNSYTFPSQVPLVFGSQVAALTASPDDASFCLSFTLDPALASGAIVVCSYDPAAEAEVQRVGGVGIIFIATSSGSFKFSLPATFVSSNAAFAIRDYVVATANPTGVILPTEALLPETPAPVIAAFSSRGPSKRNPDILKPDITAPGVDILASFSPLALEGAAGNLSYNIISGTSMACPHIAGVAALIKAAHPDWSPAAIRSAIMTTAYQVDNTLNETIRTLPLGTVGGYYDYGAGHVQPLKALEPGLVYDILPDDYVNYLCSFYPYGENMTCPPVVAARYNLNYPSINVASLAGKVTVERTLTNVGPQGLVAYTAAIASPYGVMATVVPSTLQFQFLGQQLAFTVEFDLQIRTNSVAFGTLQWSDGVHFVTSPIAVTPAF